ncbi:nicotinate-nucleotide--dimethylbenzimidazole phosphoribosyltransferase [Echinimonas agarilytica]|uniref:Nicotinate-nucleotide--dimethylbenzimidazole phosphoribosyltransferase n=1 Tax=Echinimonas agarilytica TaxID=1215918 RepID=A0AA41WB44_9GAMM|nr:nicotinate-nucleotide--dimethylbenzimidazole phosphoribosyltransferase [Echinimonas agarilytica]MCM2681141.1 nicotinate-nucleotide--dimethylbenzimidazole phosphoribosyltransferase [Echinimonas agarilytica]
MAGSQLILHTLMCNVQPVDGSRRGEFEAEMNRKVKPLGSLGQLESLAIDLALMSGRTGVINHAELFLFAADHGVAQTGVSIAPQAVTAMMVEQFTRGTAAINSVCTTTNTPLNIIDAGLLNTVNHVSVIDTAVARGTQNFQHEPAMSEAVALSSILAGFKLIEHHISKGCDCVLLGEMGIGNTTSAAAIMAALTSFYTSECVGHGTGVSDEVVELKVELISKALLRIDDISDPLQVLQEVGGLEIAQMVGAMLASASLKTPVVIDGFICSAAALLAVTIEPNVRGYLIFAHLSDERGHEKMLSELHAKPLLKLGMKLGEGTGAALAVPLIRSAAACLAHMGTLEQVGLA